MPHANAVTGASVYIDEGQELPPDEAFATDGFPAAGSPRYVGPGLLVVDLDPDMAVGGDG